MLYYTHVSISLLLMAEYHNISHIFHILWICDILMTHSPVGGHLGCAHLLVIGNSATRDISEPVPVKDLL